MSDSELLKAASAGTVTAKSTVFHKSKSNGEIIPATRIKQLNRIFEASPAIEADSNVENRKLFDLKGEVLGLTTFQEYWSRHCHRHRGHNEDSPQTSNRMHPEALDSIFAEPWFLQKNIVTARLCYPFEYVKDGYGGEYFMAINGKFITVAGVKLLDLIHYFIDGVLYKITGFVEQTEFATLSEAFLAKYGDRPVVTPISVQNSYGATFNGEQFVWENDACTLVLRELSGNVSKSTFVMYHKELAHEFNRRRPGPNLADL